MKVQCTDTNLVMSTFSKRDLAGRESDCHQSGSGHVQTSGQQRFYKSDRRIRHQVVVVDDVVVVVVRRRVLQSISFSWSKMKLRIAEQMSSHTSFCLAYCQVNQSWNVDGNTTGRSQYGRGCAILQDGETGEFASIMSCLILTSFSVLQSFKDVHIEGGVQTDEFCEACDAVIQFFGAFPKFPFERNSC